MRFTCLLILGSIFTATIVQSQTRLVQGSVSDAEGKTISYVNIAVKNTTVGTITDDKGAF